jgi:glyoxalase family protein
VGVDATTPSASIALGPIHQVTVMVSDIEKSRTFYEDVLGLVITTSGQPELPHGNNPTSDQSSNSHRNQAAVLLKPTADTDPRFRLGAGLTHHFALETNDLADLVTWRDYLNEMGVHATDIKDRTYFKSIYFRDPDGQVVEIATTGPGFAIDEPPPELGQHLALPPWLEGRRTEITSRLPSLTSRPLAAASR